MSSISFNDIDTMTTYNLGMERIIDVVNTLNKTVVQKNLTQWMNLTSEDFGAYDAVIMFQPLPMCEGGMSNDLPLGYNPFANSEGWGPALDGNVIISFSREDDDEIGMNLRRQGILFALEAGMSRTGAYISLGKTYSCLVNYRLDWLEKAFNTTSEYNSNGFVVNPKKRGIATFT